MSMAFVPDERAAAAAGGSALACQRVCPEHRRALQVDEESFANVVPVCCGPEGTHTCRAWLVLDPVTGKVIGRGGMDERDIDAGGAVDLGRPSWPAPLNSVPTRTVRGRRSRSWEMSW